METVKIIIDTKGSDRGFEELVSGAAQAIQKFEELKVILVGDEEQLQEQCKSLGLAADKYEILAAKDEITNYDSPAEAVFKKQDSSMLVGMKTLSERNDVAGMITAGNTGVAITGAMRWLSGRERVRPALAAVLPCADGSFTCLVDTGATIDCTPQMLHHFARLGADFMKRAYGLDAPKIGLLSNGAEPTKGNKLVKETYPLLSDDEALNFIGNVEGNVALSGMCDVLVCDGFAGNQVLKVTEGTATRIITDVMTYAHKEGSAEIRQLGLHLMQLYDIGSLGGGIILGIAKPVIKIRGNAGGKAIVSTAEMILNMAANKAVFDKNRNKI